MQVNGEQGRRGARRAKRSREAAGTLASVRPGQHVMIARIRDDSARAQALRFGMGEGSTVSCVVTLPAGPLVLRSGRQEIAVGRGLARRILIEPQAVA